MLPSIHLSLPVSVNSAATFDDRGDVDQSRDVHSRTVGVTAFFNQSSLLTIILSRLVSDKIGRFRRQFFNLSCDVEIGPF